MKVLVTGAKGMLGKDIVSTFRGAGHDVLETDRATLDITDADAVERFVQKEQPDVLINCAAYNLVDNVEDEAVYPVAFAINAEGPKYLAQAAKDAGATFVHYSTDYVFPGEKPEGYTESDATGPISRYGETKEAGEKFVQEVGGKYYICRLSKIFGEPGLTEGSKESFVALMLRLAEEKPELNIVNEEVGTPGYTPDIAKATLDLVTGDYAPGIYHMVNEGRPVHWYEFAKEIFDLAGVKTPYHPVPSSAFPKPAKRPKYGPLLNTKLPKLPERSEALKMFLSRDR